MARPTKFQEEYIPIIKLLAEKGCTDQEMATAIGVTEQTFNNWKKSQPEFFESLKEAKEIADKRVERSLYERAIGYTHPEEKIFNNNGAIIRANTHKHYPPDPTSMIFWLKNRKPKEWRDKQELEHSGPNGEQIAFKVIFVEPDTD